MKTIATAVVLAILVGGASVASAQTAPTPIPLTTPMPMATPLPAVTPAPTTTPASVPSSLPPAGPLNPPMR
jgi:hypothetical protein